MALLETWMSQVKAAKKYYTCPFCEEKREINDKTDIQYMSKWYNGCQRCYIKSITDPHKWHSTIFYL